MNKHLTVKTGIIYTAHAIKKFTFWNFNPTNFIEKNSGAHQNLRKHTARKVGSKLKSNLENNKSKPNLTATVFVNGESMSLGFIMQIKCFNLETEIIKKCFLLCCSVSVFSNDFQVFEGPSLWETSVVATLYTF